MSQTATAIINRRPCSLGKVTPTMQKTVEEEVKELLPCKAAILRAGSYLHSVLELSMVTELQSIHEFRVLNKLFDEFILGNIVLTSELLVTFF